MKQWSGSRNDEVECRFSNDDFRFVGRGIRTLMTLIFMITTDSESEVNIPNDK